MKKKMNQKEKRTLIVGISIIAVCLLIAGVYIAFNLSTSREATQADIDAFAPYDIDWLTLTEEDQTHKQIILSYCTEGEEQTVGSNTYKTYTSNGLEDHLYKCAAVKEIILTDTDVMLSYTDTDGQTVILGYGDQGLTEMAVYNPADDTLFHYIDGTATVWNKFYNGIHFG
ncbi:MAG: hypothetical protein IJ422_06005 [Oscillospiraceae bacterium]|nr:hypothetical protein [Oscillospiraceae bacterium]